MSTSDSGRVDTETVQVFKAAVFIPFSDELRRDHQWLWTGPEWADHARELQAEIGSLEVDRIGESNPWKRGWITRRLKAVSTARVFAWAAAAKGGVSFAEYVGWDL